MITSYHPLQSCFWDDKTTYPEKSQVITRVMMSFTGSKKDKFLRNSTMISIPMFCPASPQVSIQNPRTLKWKLTVITSKAEGTPRSYNISTEHGKELRRKRSQQRQISQKPSKYVRFGMKNNQSHQFTPNTEHVMAKTMPCQTNQGDSLLLDTEQARPPVPLEAIM